ncbi:MAG: PqiC family protein [Syntrophobacteraceae bacterium]|jgi:hypothetical protein
MFRVPVSRLAAVLVVIMLLGGCGGSKAANYYILHSIQNPGPELGAAGTERDPAIGVGPVTIPDYLDRPQIVTRTTDSSLQFAEFDRWAEPLEKNLARVLADNLSVMVPSERVYVFPWPKSVAVRCRVTLEIAHLEKMPDEKVLLDARWNVLDGDKLLAAKRSRLVLPVEGAGFEAVASAQSRAVEALSREIATEIRSLPVEKRAGE